MNIRSMLQKNYIVVITFLILLLFSIIGVASYYSPKEVFEVTKKEKPVVYIIGDEIQGESAIIYDLSESKTLAQKNPFIPRPIASITKLAAVVTAYPLLTADDISEITFEEESIVANTPLQIGSNWSSLELLKYSLITSSNRGINAVSRTIFEKTGESLVDRMNAFALDNRLVATHFINETGLDANGSLSGSESSAYDIAIIAKLFFQLAPQFAFETSKIEESFYSLSGEQYDAKNTNILVGKIPYSVYLSKTGYTNIAGGTLVMVSEIIPGHLVVAVVLGSTKSGRFKDMQLLFDIAKRILTKDSSVTEESTTATTSTTTSNIDI